MKQALAILAVIALVAAVSAAQSTVYTPTKDAFLKYDNGAASTDMALGGLATSYAGAAEETRGTGSGGAAYRAGKGYQDQFIMEFDRATILSDLKIALGGADDATVQAALNSGAVTVTLELMASANGFNHAAKYFPAYFTSTTNVNLENHISYNYANDQNQVAANGWWNGGVNNSQAAGAQDTSRGATTGNVPNYCRLDCPTFYAPGSDQVWSAADYTWQAFNYTGSTFASYLYSTDYAFMEMYLNKSAGDNNGNCYSKEQPNCAPKLTVTVPEPCSMLMLAAGAVATLIRRRK